MNASYLMKLLKRKAPPHIWVSPGMGKVVFPGPWQSVALRFFSSSVQYSFSHFLPGPPLNSYTFLSHLPLTVLIGLSAISAIVRPLGVRKQGLSLLLASALLPPHFIPGKVRCEPTLGIEDAIDGTVSSLRYAQSQASTCECGLCRCNPVAKWSC